MLARLPRPVRYLLQILFVVAATGVANFFLLKLVPGDLVDVIAAENSGITPAHVAELRQAYGLDQGVLSQLGYYLKSLASLDPVSYTHLDVYKRQVLYTPRSCNSGTTRSTKSA